MNNHKYRPEVQARKAGKLNLNDYSRSQYIETLESLGQTKVRGLSKLEAYRRILDAKAAHLVDKMHSWRS